MNALTVSRQLPGVCQSEKFNSDDAWEAIGCILNLIIAAGVYTAFITYCRD